MSISRGWGPGLLTASWLNSGVMNGPGAWLWNGLQLLLLSVDARHSAASMSKCKSDLLHQKVTEKKKLLKIQPLQMRKERESLKCLFQITAGCYSTDVSYYLTFCSHQKSISECFETNIFPSSACFVIGQHLNPIVLVTTTPIRYPTFPPKHAHAHTHMRAHRHPLSSPGLLYE